MILQGDQWILVDDTKPIIETNNLTSMNNYVYIYEQVNNVRDVISEQIIEAENINNVEGYLEASTSKTFLQEQYDVTIDDKEEMLSNDENECLYNSPLSENSPLSIIFEAKMKKSNDNQKLDVVKYLNVPLIIGWKVMSYLRKYFKTSNPKVKNNIMHAFDKFIYPSRKRFGSFSEDLDAYAKVGKYDINKANEAISDYEGLRNNILHKSEVENEELSKLYNSFSEECKEVCEGCGKLFTRLIQHIKRSPCLEVYKGRLEQMEKDKREQKRVRDRKGKQEKRKNEEVREAERKADKRLKEEKRKND